MLTLRELLTIAAATLCGIAVLIVIGEIGKQHGSMGYAGALAALAVVLYGVAVNLSAPKGGA